MTDTPRTDDPQPNAPPKRRGARWWVGPMVAFVAESVAFTSAVGLLVSGQMMDALWIVQLALLFAMLLAILWVGAMRRRDWSEPLARLAALLPKVHAGEEPIESLAGIGGKLEPIARTCAQLLRELRGEKAQMAELRQEMQQRVATRTVALERAIGSLRQQAVRDPLTGLFNRRMLDAYLPEAIERCKSASSPMCLLMIDVDYFKPLNDSLGHAAGDQMLRSIAQIIRSTIRETDAAFRCGGDEFVVVLEGHDMESGQSLGKRIASLADALGRTFRVAQAPRLSVGIATVPPAHALTAHDLLTKADEVLYQIKAEHHTEDAMARTRRSA